MLNNVEKELKNFAKYVVTKSRMNLRSSDKNASGKLSKSLDSDVKESKNSFQLSFMMEEYGLFQDKGVRGKSSSKKAPKSPYKYGSGTGKKGGLTEGINKWVKRKRFQFRDRKSGKFLSYDSTAFLISRSIYHKGIAPSLFFTKPFEKAFKNIDKDLIKAYKLDIETLMNNSINNK
mgnify:FL=1|tara:strand:- start:372 stop:899 length:528 start_codon:yes stop_codon:yes gene_type:complete